MADTQQEAQITFEPAFVPESEIIIPLKEVIGKPQVVKSVEKAEKKSLIFNIETLGLDPLKARIITIGLQDSMVPNENPTIIMLEDEAEMLRSLFTIISEGDFTELIGYNLSFDFRFILLRAMYHGINCQEFYNCSLFDLMQAMQQGKLAFVYNPQKAPNLSDVADFLFNYPKPFTDVEMMEYYKKGERDKVLEFASSQITRTLALYWTFRLISETPFITAASGKPSSNSMLDRTPASSYESKLTIPEAFIPETITLKCPTCLAEDDFAPGTKTATCKICNSQMAIKR